MSAKNVDNHNRFRNITVGFRVSPEENEAINAAVKLSGLPKQEYCYRRCLERDIVVQGNPRVYKALRDQLAAVLTELQRIENAGGVTDELLELIGTVVDRGKKRVRLTIPYASSGVVDGLHRDAQIISLEYTENGIEAEAVLNPDMYGRLREFISEDQ